MHNQLGVLIISKHYCSELVKLNIIFASLHRPTCRYIGSYHVAPCTFRRFPLSRFQRPHHCMVIRYLHRRQALISSNGVNAGNG